MKPDQILDIIGVYWEDIRGIWPVLAYNKSDERANNNLDDINNKIDDIFEEVMTRKIFDIKILHALKTVKKYIRGIYKDELNQSQVVKLLSDDIKFINYIIKEYYPSKNWNYQNICITNGYDNKSVEELRFESQYEPPNMVENIYHYSESEEVEDNDNKDIYQPQQQQQHNNIIQQQNNNIKEEKEEYINISNESAMDDVKNLSDAELDPCIELPDDVIDDNNDIILELTNNIKENIIINIIDRKTHQHITINYNLGINDINYYINDILNEDIKDISCEDSNNIKILDDIQKNDNQLNDIKHHSEVMEQPKDNINAVKNLINYDNNININKSQNNYNDYIRKEPEYIEDGINKATNMNSLFINNTYGLYQYISNSCDIQLDDDYNTNNGILTTKKLSSTDDTKFITSKDEYNTPHNDLLKYYSSTDDYKTTLSSQKVRGLLTCDCAVISTMDTHIIYKEILSIDLSRGKLGNNTDLNKNPINNLSQFNTTPTNYNNNNNNLYHL